MGLFSKPKCPRCGGKIEPTGYSAPFAQWRCRRCLNESIERRQQEERIKKLENKVKELSKLK